MTDERKHVFLLLGKQALSELKESFTLVGDRKTATSVGSAVVERGMAREYARTLVGMRPIRVQVVQEIATVTVAANTAVAVSTPANFVAATEFSSWAALFDEVRCEHYDAKYLVGTSGSAVSTDGVAFAVAVSPAINTAPSSVAQTVGFTRFAGPAPIHPVTGGGTAGLANGSSLTAVSNHGTMEIRSGPLVKGVTTNNSGGTMTVNPVQGNWVPTGTNSAHAGYLLLYADAPGANVSWWYRAWIWYTLEFRARSG